MRKINILFFIFAIANNTYSKTITLAEAWKDGLVDCIPKYRNDLPSQGEERHANMELTLYNKTNKDLNILVESGTWFDEMSNTKQDQVTAENVLVNLEKHHLKKVYLHGFCIQHSKSSPDQKTLFAIYPPKDSNYKKLAVWINVNKFFNHAAQSAFWSISDGLPIDNIYFRDLKMTLELWELLAEITKQKTPKKEDYKEQFVVYESFDGKIDHLAQKPQTVSIIIEDKNGKVLSKMLDHKEIQNGNYHFKYRVSKNMSSSDEIYVKFIVDDVTVKNIRHLMNIQS